MRDREFPQDQVMDASFAFFVHHRFIPALDKIGQLTDETKDVFVSAELLETFLWLHHGVRIGYFPSARARLLMYENFQPFLIALDVMMAGSHFETWFADPIQRTLEAQFSGRDVPFVATPRPTSAPELSLFQQSAILSNGLAKNRTARPFLQALATLDDPGWTDAINRGTVPPGIELNPDEQHSEDRKLDWIYSGFFACLDYMRAFRLVDMNSILDMPPNSNLSDSFRTVRDIQQWRLNFGYPRYEEKFMQVGRLAANKYGHTFFAAAEGADPTYFEKRFIKELKELTSGWGAPFSNVAGA